MCALLHEHEWRDGGMEERVGMEGGVGMGEGVGCGGRCGDEKDIMQSLIYLLSECITSLMLCQIGRTKHSSWPV